MKLNVAFGIALASSLAFVTVGCEDLFKSSSSEELAEESSLDSGSPSELIESSEEKALEIKEDTENAASEAGAAIKENAEGAGEKLEEKAEEIKEEASEGLENAKESASEKIEDAKKLMDSDAE